MTRSAGARLAWGLFVGYVAIVTATLWQAATAARAGDASFVLFAMGFALVGALVASREPRNAVGWLLLATAVFVAVSGWTDQYVLVAGRPGEVAAGWVDSWDWYVWLLIPAYLLPLLFPTGRLLSPRWRPALWLVLITVVLTVASTAFAGGPLDIDSATRMQNPLGLTGAAGDALGAAGDVATALSVASAVLAWASLVLRLRRSAGRERQQVKLFAYVGSLVLAGLAGASVPSVTDEPAPRAAEVIGDAGWTLALMSIIVGLPVAVGIAILRHRLYEIDVVINRTLVYGALSAVLVAAYLAGVLLLRLVLTPVTGTSDLAVAGSTLAVAALFRPLRAQIQTGVDRRFYRSRYDSARTLQDFTQELRHELDLEALGDDLRRVVVDTMHPSSVSLWLRGVR